MSATDALKTALTELAAIRASSVTLNEIMHRAKAAFNEQHVELINSINDHTARLAEAEALVRSLTLACYEMDPTTKKPVVGVGVKVETKYGYDPAAVLEWARKNRETFPTLIVETLEPKQLKALVAAKVVPGVVVKEELAATIAGDISEYLLIPEPAATVEGVTHV